MSWIDGPRARLRLFFARNAAESRFETEIRFHIEMETERLVRETGLDRDEAARRALAVFGGIERHRESLRDGRGLRWLDGMLLDLRLGMRMLAKSPGLTLVGVLGMSVGIAIAAVSFGIIRTLIGTSVPLDEGDRVVVIQNVDTRRSAQDAGTHLHDIATWRESLSAITELGAYRTVDRNLITGDGRPEPVRIAEMTASGFRIARVPPRLGRYFSDDDERSGTAPVVVIGYSIWQGRFAGAADVVGRTIQLGATAHTVVGVMPQDFAFPISNSLWTPFKLDPSAFARGSAPPIQVFGRLAASATVDEVQTQLTTIGKRFAAAHPESHQYVRPRVLPYALSFFESPELTWKLYLVQLLVSLILVVIGTNVATLVYARTASRVGEIAVRTALGASRARVVAQLFTEALVLSAAAATLGLGGAALALRHADEYLARMMGEQLPFWMNFGLSPGMVLYVAGLAVLGALIVGVFPALEATKRHVQANLQRLGTGGSGMRLGTTWTVLIVAQVAVAVALLPIVLIATFVQRRGEVVPGPRFLTTEWVAASLHLDREGAATGPGQDHGAHALRFAAIEAELVRRLKAEPGVSDVVLTSAVPGGEPKIRIEVAGAPATAKPDSAGGAASAGHVVATARVGPEFFRAFGVPVLVGRGFQTGDVSSEATAVIVNRSFVAQVLRGGEPLGRRIREAPREGNAASENPADRPWYEIVGVVPDFPSPEHPADIRPRMYQPLLPGTTLPLTLAVRVKGAAPATFAGRLRELAVAVDPMLRPADIRALHETLTMAGMAERVVFTAVALVTLSVLLLSAAGIYALMSFTIVRRRREIGIRAALGAGPGHLLGSVLAKAAGQIAIGIVVGTTMAAIAAQNIQGVTPHMRSVLLFTAVAVFMAIIGLFSALGPARRALRIQPTEALRTE